MGLVNPVTPTDGTTADASDVTNPINTLANEINGNLDNANIASDAAIAGSKLADGSVTPAKLETGAGSGWAWQSWVPTWTNASVGNGSVTAEYVQVGKTVFYKLIFVFGSTSSITGNPSFSLPVTSVAVENAGIEIGSGYLRDSNGSVVLGSVLHGSTTTGQVTYHAVSGSLVIRGGVSSSAPFTWATNDGILLQGCYEAA